MTFFNLSDLVALFCLIVARLTFLAKKKAIKMADTKINYITKIVLHETGKICGT